MTNQNPIQTNPIQANIQSLLTTGTNTMSTQIQTLIQEGKELITSFDAARNWLSTNLTNLPTLSTTTASSDEWVMSTIFGLATEGHMSLTGIMRLMSVHVESVDFDDTKDYETATNCAIVSDARSVLQMLKDTRIIAPTRTRMEAKRDGTVTNTYYIYKATAQFTYSLDMFLATAKDNATMVCKPLHEAPTAWESNDGIITGTGNLRLVKGASLVSQAVLDAVNKVQSVGYRYNTEIMKLVTKTLRNDSLSKEDRRVYEAIRDLRVKGESEFYFPVTVDFRGRMYYRGGLITPQGEKIVKALLEFSEGVALGETGLYWLEVHTANVLGKDKKSMDNRIKYIHSVRADIESVTDYGSFLVAFPDADEYTGYVAVLELQRAYQAPVIEEFISHLILHIDGTNNGLQHASVITRDRGTAEAVNITASASSDDVRDLYDDITVWALEADNLSSEARHLITMYTRDLGKPVVMLKGYGAGDTTIAEGIDKVYAKKGIKPSQSVRKEVATALITALDNKAGAVSKLVNALKYVAKDFGQNSINWTTADGFTVVQSYKDFTEQERSVGKLSIRLVGKGKDDLIKAQTALAPNFVHSLDATHLRLLALATDAPLALVHDSVGTHAGNMQEVSIKVRETFVKLHSYDQCASILDFTNGFEDDLDFTGTYDVNEALQSTYIFS